VPREPELQQGEILGRVTGNRRVAPNPATIDETEVMIPKLKSIDNGLSMCIKLD